jgi:hypothetical protein
MEQYFQFSPLSVITVCRTMYGLQSTIFFFIESATKYVELFANGMYLKASRVICRSPLITHRSRLKMAQNLVGV